MTPPEDLYTALKPSMAALATPLFDLSAKFLRKNGDFLPHAALLDESGHVRLVAAMGDEDRSTPSQILTLLHGGLRGSVAGGGVDAVAVAEDVTIALDGRAPISAIKVQFEHRFGLNVALYMPFVKTFFKGYTFGQPFSLQAAPEVDAWSPGPLTARAA